MTQQHRKEAQKETKKKKRKKMISKDNENLKALVERGGYASDLFSIGLGCVRV